MSIQGFYNTTAIYEVPTVTTDDYGQEVKTWSVSTWFAGTRQSRSGSKAIVDAQERLNVSERFYCDYVSIESTGRLVFSTNSFVYKGSASASSDLAASNDGDLYSISSSFSTYAVGDYAIYSATSADYILSTMTYRYITYINDQLRSRHLQIDLDIGYKNRT